MAPKRDNSNANLTRLSNRRGHRTTTTQRYEHGKRLDATIHEDDGDVLMTGYRIPTVISSKGAIQHKLDRYAPHKRRPDTSRKHQAPDRYKSHGHKRYGGHYDEPRYKHDSRYDPTPAEEHTQRYGNEDKQHRSSRVEGKYRYSNHERSSRRDKYTREYHNVVTSSRSRYEHDGAGYHGHHASTRTERYGRRYDPTEYRGSSKYSNGQNSHDHHRKTAAEGSYRSSRHNNDSRSDTSRLWDTSSRSHKPAHSRSSYDRPDHEPNFDFGGDFEGAMKTLAVHAENFLRNAHWRDREEVEAAVWKAYGDSIASLGYRKTRGLSEGRPKGWVSVNGINNWRDNDSFAGVPRGPRSMQDRVTSGRDSSSTHRSRVLEKYQQANNDYERTLDDLFGKSSHAGSSYIRPTSRSQHQYERSESPRVGSYNNSHSQSIRSNSTVTSSRIRQEIPRPRPPPLFQTPIYIPDPKDPMRYLNVPRPRMREQWHIPSDFYNGEAWADNRKREIESGAFSSLYPDKWFSGDSYGDTTKASTLYPEKWSGGDSYGDTTKASTPQSQPTRGDNIIGRDCYTEVTNLSVGDGRSRSHSVASGLGDNFNKIRLTSTTPLSAPTRAYSELPEDFDLYGPPAITPDRTLRSEHTVPTHSEKSYHGNNTPVQSIACLSEGQIDQFDDGSRTPRQHAPSSERSVSLSLTREGDRYGDDTASDNDYYQSSREATPTLCLANMVGYTPQTVTSSLVNGHKKASLIDIVPSIPSSPNASRSGAVTPSYYSKVNYSPLRSQSELYGSPTHPSGVYNNLPAGEDWDSSFHSVSTINNSVFIADNESIGGHDMSIKEGILVDLTNSEMMSDDVNDDDLDFLGIEFFSKTA